MIKKLIAGAALCCFASTASAAFIIDESVVTGDEMVGLDVTVKFRDGTDESRTWVATNSTLSPGLTIVEQQEGLSGGAFGSSWQLTQAGNSVGNTDGGTPPKLFGLWTLENRGGATSDLDIVGLVLDGTSAMLAFDNIFGPEETPGSATGREYQNETGIGTAMYSNQVSAMWDDLWWTVEITFDAGEELVANQVTRFFSDVDSLKDAPTMVSAPSTIAIAALGLLVTARLRKKA